jgi:hypothetical protein
MLGGLVGPAIGGLLADMAGNRAPFTLTGIAALLAALYGALRLPETRKFKKETSPVPEEAPRMASTEVLSPHSLSLSRCCPARPPAMSNPLLAPKSPFHPFTCWFFLQVHTLLAASVPIRILIYTCTHRYPHSLQPLSAPPTPGGREGGREGERQTDRQTDRQRDRETQRPSANGVRFLLCFAGQGLCVTEVGNGGQVVEAAASTSSPTQDAAGPTVVTSEEAKGKRR